MSIVKVEFDCSTGERKEIVLTGQELIDHEARAAADAEEYSRKKEAENAAKASEAAARESARAKLAALGLTEAEVAALVK